MYNVIYLYIFFFFPDPSSQRFFYSVFSKNQLLVLLVFIAFLFSILLVSILFFVSLLILFWGLLCFFKLLRFDTKVINLPWGHLSASWTELSNSCFERTLGWGGQMWRPRTQWGEEESNQDPPQGSRTLHLTLVLSLQTIANCLKKKKPTRRRIIEESSATAFW